MAGNEIISLPQVFVLHQMGPLVYHSTGLKFVIDSAFCTQAAKFLIKTSQDYLLTDADTVNDMAEALAEKREATLMRQSAERGRRAFQAFFPRMNDVFPCEERGERGIIITAFMLLYNCRARILFITITITVVVILILLSLIKKWW